MMVSRRTVYLGVCLAGAGCLAMMGLFYPAPPTDSGPPNIVLIVVDTLRADRLTGERGGMPLMPKLREFASESRWFKDAVSQSSWTKPAMASLFTSLYFSVHGVQVGNVTKVIEKQSLVVDALPGPMETMAEYLEQQGFHTAGLQTNPQLEAGIGFAQGFDSYEYYSPDTKADRVTDLSLQALGNTPSPFFLYVHYMDPHNPYSPPKPYDSMFGPQPAVSDQDRDLLNHFQDFYFDKCLVDVGVQAKRQFGDLSEAGQEHLRYAYDGEVRFIDDEVGRLIAAIRERRPNTIIVFTADHGEEFWEHGSIGHGKTVYQELVRVPLVIHLPDAPPRVSENRVELVDVLPTLAAHLNMPSNPLWQGRDLMHVGMQGSSAAPENRAAFSRTRTALREANVDLETVLQGKYKLIADRKTDVFRLFDVDADPGETADCSRDLPNVASALRAFLDAHEAANAQHPLAHVRATATIEDETTLNELRAIGYYK